MRQVLMLGVCCLLGFVVGCGEEGGRLDADQFRVRIEKIAEYDDMVIVRLDVKVVGKKSVKLHEPHGSGTSTVFALPDSRVSECDILLVGVLMGDRVKWLDRVRSPSGYAGGPKFVSVDEGASLKELFELKIVDGDYDLGADIEVCVFNGDSFKLRVE